MAQEFRNGEENTNEIEHQRGAQPGTPPESDQWPPADRPPADEPSRMSFATDDSDAPVSLGDRPGRDDAGAGSTSDSSGDDLVELRNAGARDIDATTVSITQGGARDVEATTVTISQGGAARIRADEVTVSQGGIGLARADNLTIKEGGTAFAVITENAEMNAETSVFLLVAGSASGDVRPFMDWRAAAAFGAGFALVLTIMRRGRR